MIGVEKAEFVSDILNFLPFEQPLTRQNHFLFPNILLRRCAELGLKIVRDKGYRAVGGSGERLNL